MTDSNILLKNTVFTRDCLLAIYPFGLSLSKPLLV